MADYCTPSNCYSGTIASNLYRIVTFLAARRLSVIPTVPDNGLLLSPQRDDISTILSVSACVGYRRETRETPFAAEKTPQSHASMRPVPDSED